MESFIFVQYDENWNAFNSQFLRMHYHWVLGNLSKTGIINNSSDTFEISVITVSYNNFERNVIWTKRFT